MVEWLLSFILMFVIMAVATDDRVVPGFAAIAIGVTVGMDAMMGGSLTGASMNPARTLGPAVAAGVWKAHWLYWVAPISAMIVAVRFYEVIRPAQLRLADAPLGTEGPIL
jgi:aquaporin Z